MIGVRVTVGWIVLVAILAFVWFFFLRKRTA